MYYHDLETKAQAKEDHNKRQRANAKDRLKAVAQKKKARKA